MIYRSIFYSKTIFFNKYFLILLYFNFTITYFFYFTHSRRVTITIYFYKTDGFLKRSFFHKNNINSSIKIKMYSK
jgi:hypothetical protein